MMSLYRQIKNVEHVICDLILLDSRLRLIEDLIDPCNKSSASDIETNIPSLDDIYSTLGTHFFISGQIEVSKECGDLFVLYNTFADYIDEMVDHENGNRKEGHVFLDKLSPQIDFIEDVMKIIDIGEAGDIMYEDLKDLLEMMKEEIAIKKIQLREREAGRSLDGVLVGPNGVTPWDSVGFDKVCKELWEKEPSTCGRRF